MPNTNPEGWNLIANPYPSAINVSTFLLENDNIEGAIYVWDDNDSETVRGSSDDYIIVNGVTYTRNSQAENGDRYNQHLGSAQGFFVKLSGDTDTSIDFTETMRVTGENADEHFFRQANVPIARVNLTNETGLFKQTVLAIVNDGNAEVTNRLYDAPSFNPESSEGVFTLKGEEVLSINGLPIGWETSKLQMNIADSGTYILSAELEHYDDHLYLFDRETSAWTDLSTQNNQFKSAEGIFPDRFVLASAPHGSLSINILKAVIYVTGRKLVIHDRSEEDKTYLLYDLLGKVRKSITNTGENVYDLSHLESGIYFVSDGLASQKVYLR